jgi:hypothetical protein
MNCPICTAPITITSPKPRCLNCGYLESCCNPEIPCEILAGVREQGVDLEDKRDKSKTTPNPSTS